MALSIKHTVIAILSTVILLLLSGCSRTQFFYHQLDWFIPRYINHYISLDERQYQAVKQHTSAFMQWHCTEHMDKYAGWFLRLRQDIQHNQIDFKKLEFYSEELHAYWLELVDRYMPELAKILYSASDKQVLELIENLTEKNQELFEELVQPSALEVEDELAKRMEERFDAWLGSVTGKQRNAIKAWAKGAQSRQRLRLIMRERWKNRLHHLLLYRDGMQTFERNVLILIRNPEYVWTDSYRKQFITARTDTLKLLQLTFANLTNKQRDHLLERLDKWARDMKALSCKKTIEPTAVP